MKTREEKRARERAYYAANKERIRARRRAIWGQHHRDRNRAYVAQNKERFYEYQTSYRLGIDRAQIRAIRAAQ